MNISRSAIIFISFITFVQARANAHQKIYYWVTQFLL